MDRGPFKDRRSSQGASEGSIEMSQCSVHHKPSKAQMKAIHFSEFDQMIRDKYETKDDKFDNMSLNERNNELRKMLENENIIVFPDTGEQSQDGIPLF
jgi:hypothetical protein